MADMMTLDFALLENLARRETGRLPAPERNKAAGRLVVFPAHLQYRKQLIDRERNSVSEAYFLGYGNDHSGASYSVRNRFRYLVNLLRVLPLCAGVDLHFFSYRADWPSVLLTVIIARLLGVTINLFDYRFRSDRESKLVRMVYPLCHRLETGDISAISDDGHHFPKTTFRAELTDLSRYRNFRKEKAIPRVIVYGNFEDHRNISLIKRTHELIKQKYPRTEFFLISLTSTYRDYIAPDEFDSSITMTVPRTEENLRAVFEGSDTILLLSPGGLNRFFMVRAQAAGYPVIVNGINYPAVDRKIITTVRDSYSGLADAVIRLVDDDGYFRSFASI